MNTLQAGFDSSQMHVNNAHAIASRKFTSMPNLQNCALEPL